MPREVAIRGDTIRLGQLLKLAGVVGGGGELKGFLAATTVLVNGEPDARRGRQLHPATSSRSATRSCGSCPGDAPKGWPNGQTFPRGIAAGPPVG